MDILRGNNVDGCVDDAAMNWKPIQYDNVQPNEEDIHDDTNNTHRKRSSSTRKNTTRTKRYKRSTGSNTKDGNCNKTTTTSSSSSSTSKLLSQRYYSTNVGNSLNTFNFMDKDITHYNKMNDIMPNNFSYISNTLNIRLEGAPKELYHFNRNKGYIVIHPFLVNEDYDVHILKVICDTMYVSLPLTFYNH